MPPSKFFDYWNTLGEDELPDLGSEHMTRFFRATWQALLQAKAYAAVGDETSAHRVMNDRVWSIEHHELPALAKAAGEGADAVRAYLAETAALYRAGRLPGARIMADRTVGPLPATTPLTPTFSSPELTPAPPPLPLPERRIAPKLDPTVGLTAPSVPQRPFVSSSGERFPTKAEEEAMGAPVSPRDAAVATPATVVSPETASDPLITPPAQASPSTDARTAARQEAAEAARAQAEKVARDALRASRQTGADVVQALKKAYGLANGDQELLSRLLETERYDVFPADWQMLIAAANVQNGTPAKNAKVARDIAISLMGEGRKDYHAAWKTEFAARMGIVVTGPAGSPYDALIIATAKKHGIPPELFLALVKQESRFNPNATSQAGAKGLVQLMKRTAIGLGLHVDDHVDERTDPVKCLDAGARYLAKWLKHYKTVDKALAAYNAGPGKVETYGGVPPYKETRDYIAIITKQAALYEPLVTKLLDTARDEKKKRANTPILKSSSAQEAASASASKPATPAQVGDTISTGRPGLSSVTDVLAKRQSTAAAVPTTPGKRLAETSHVADDEWPIQVTSRKQFGDGLKIRRVHPITGEKDVLHNGIDISAPTGTPVYTPAGGKVISAGKEAKGGNTVRIQHDNGIVTGYCHLHSIAVTVGASVNARQKIGEVGSTGVSSGPHLHFSIKHKGVPVDPTNKRNWPRDATPLSPGTR